MTSNSLMPAAGEVMILSRLLIVSGVEDAMLAHAEAQRVYGRGS